MRFECGSASSSGQQQVTTNTNSNSRNNSKLILCDSFVAAANAGDCGSHIHMHIFISAPVHICSTYAHKCDTALKVHSSSSSSSLSWVFVCVCALSRNCLQSVLPACCRRRRAIDYGLLARIGTKTLESVKIHEM